MSRCPGGGDAVGVVGVDEPVVAVHGCTPVRVLQVVASTGDRPVPSHFALGGHQEGRAVRLDGSASRVDQGKTVGNCVLQTQ